MNTKSETPQTMERTSVIKGVAARFSQIVVGFVVLVLILFLPSGRLDWTWGWIFLGIYLVSVSINSTFLMRTNPEMVAERGRPAEMRGWDKVISGLWSLAQFLALPLIAALDVRFGWTGDLGLGLHIAGAIVFALGLALFSWAMITNAYFSTAVRIQSDRGQTVCRSGPYQAVRHPGYVGTILQSIAIPFLLGSWWALIPGITAAALITIRTAFEDRTLQAELPGYREFAADVRYRLIPGIW